MIFKITSKSVSGLDCVRWTCDGRLFHARRPAVTKEQPYPAGYRPASLPYRAFQELSTAVVCGMCQSQALARNRMLTAEDFERDRRREWQQLRQTLALPPDASRTSASTTTTTTATTTTTTSAAATAVSSGGN